MDKKKMGTVGSPLWFDYSEFFEPGDPRCTCSLCGEPIESAEDYFDRTDGQHKGKSYQRFHALCFQKITDLDCIVGEILMEHDREQGKY